MESNSDEIVSKKKEQQIRLLIKKQKRLIGAKKTLAKFKEPVAFLARNTGKVDFFENVRGTKFEFEHSNGEDMEIQLQNFQPQIFDYGNDTFRGWLLDEDCPFPLPQRPLLYIDQFKMIIEKVWISVMSREAEKAKQLNKLLNTIIWGAIVLIGGYILYKVIVPNRTPVDDVVEQAIVNQTVTILG